MRMYTRMPAPNSLGYLAAVGGEDQPTLATYNYHANTSGQEEIDAVNAVVQPQMEAWQAGMASALANMHAAHNAAVARAQALNAALCAQPGWPYGCGGSPCFSDAYREGAVGYGTPDPAKNYIGISCVPPAGGPRTWFAVDVPTDVVVAKYTTNYRSPVGVAAPQPSAAGTGTTPSYMPTTPNDVPGNPGGFQSSASPGNNYAGYLPPAATAASNSGSNPVSTAGGVVGGIMETVSGISPVMLVAAAAAAYFIFIKGSK